MFVHKCDGQARHQHATVSEARACEQDYADYVEAQIDALRGEMAVAEMLATR